MNNRIVWPSTFSDRFGSGMVFRQFAAGGSIYAVGFEEIETMADFTRKGINVLSVYPAFRFPQSGVWGITFDEIDLTTMDFKGFQHVQHLGLAGGRILFNVASVIYEHYNCCHAGAYVFSAASDPYQLRRTDLLELYSRAPGIGGYQKSKLFTELFDGWQAYSDAATGGRGYVVTTEHY